MLANNQILEAREMRGHEITANQKITQLDTHTFLVPSQSTNNSYRVQFLEGECTCNCPDHQYRKMKCKHIFAVEISITKEIDEKGIVTETKTATVTYSQDWTAYDLAQTQQKELFMQLLRDVSSTVKQPEYIFGRPRLPLADMVFVSAFKVFCAFSLRRFTSDMKLAMERGYIDKVPYYSSVARYMENPELTPIIKELITISSLPLVTIETDFTIDSSGFGTFRFVKWFDHKYGKD